MTYTLTLQIPEDVYKALLAHAQSAGQPLEQFIVSQLSAHISFDQDPLHRLIGILEASAPDWVEKHDYYIGLSALDVPEK